MSNKDKGQPRHYYYFYGSTTEVGDEENAAKSNVPMSPSVESDTLVGESLVSTDNEEETPLKMERDHRQLMIPHHDGGLRPLPSHQERDEYTCFDTCCPCKRHARRSLMNNNFLYAIAAAVLFTGLLTLMLIPEHNSNSNKSQPEGSTNPTTISQQTERQFKVLFPQVDRAESGDPVEKFMDTTLFHSTLLYSTSKGHGANDNQNKTILNKRMFRFPFPTGAFWTNLVLKSNTGQGFSYPIVAYPYAFKWSGSQVAASYPYLHRKETSKEIHDYFIPELFFGTSELVNDRKIVAFDPLSITLRFSKSEKSYWETYLVQGTPYITMKYIKMQPSIHALSIFTNVLCPHEDQPSTTDEDRNRRRRLLGVCRSSGGTPDDPTLSLRGVQFVLETNEGYRWLVFSSTLVTLEFDTIRKTTVTAVSESSDAFTGVLRFAIIPPQDETNKVANPSAELKRLSESTAVQRLIYHAGVYPISGSVSWAFRSSGGDTVSDSIAALTGSSQQSPKPRIAKIGFRYNTLSFSSSSTGSAPKALLMLTLPHHVRGLSGGSPLNHKDFDLTFHCIKGPMYPVLGSTWSYDELLPSLTFDNDVGASRKRLYLDPTVRSIIAVTLKEDLEFALPMANDDIYGFGKKTARLAQLLHIATALNATVAGRDNSSSSSHIDVIVSRAAHLAKNQLQDRLSALLQSELSDSLIYDATLGGLVSKHGLKDSNTDFGNGRYNDHLFHYGYILYSSAILGKHDPDFVKQFGNEVDAIYYDVSNSANFNSDESNGAFFPGARHKSWFDGHSFASGLFPFANGKSQESSSEAVNCYYGAYLWSLVRNNAISNPSSDTSPRTDFARLLLATEIRGAQMYWHILNPQASNRTNVSSIYPPDFTIDGDMVGNMGMLDAIKSTWFGTNELYIHLINFIPVTTITGALFRPNFVSKEVANILSKLGEVEIAWKGYSVANQAIVDPNSAWASATEILSRALDTAISKTQVLFWIATRDGFDPTSVAPDDNQSDENDSDKRKPDSSRASCANYKSCLKAGLSAPGALCCPTTAGVTLDCCVR